MFSVGDAVRFIKDVGGDVYIVTYIHFHNYLLLGYDVQSLQGKVVLFVPGDELELVPDEDVIAEENYKRAMQGV